MYEPIDSFENRLRKALEYKGVKPIELANKLNLNKGIISQYLQGKYYPKQKRLSQIANILNVSEQYLLGYDVPLNNEKTYLDKFNMLSAANKKVVKSLIDNLIEQQRRWNKWILKRKLRKQTL